MYRTDTLGSMPLFGAELVRARTARVTEAAMDETIAESFPASDPPAWNPGLARLMPAAIAEAPRRDVYPPANLDVPITSGPGVIDVSQPRKPNRTAVEVAISIGALVGVVLLAPLAVLTVGTPLAAAVRGLLELIRWSLSLVHG